MRFIHNDPILKERRRFLRNNSTPEEVALWNYLKGRRLGQKFRRQFSVGQFIVDFYCHELKLVIELDGGQHETNRQYDQERDAFLHHQGCFIIRFPNSFINANLQKAIEIIQGHIFLLSEQ